MRETSQRRFASKKSKRRIEAKKKSGSMSLEEAASKKSKPRAMRRQEVKAGKVETSFAKDTRGMVW